ncbi:MAG: extracellular solute-binding protein, partial [Chloroflexi bacterium]|nr:extracellular solute-binding protein [Chloroflexota bacterium]
PGGLGAVVAMLAPLPNEITGLVPAWAHSPESKWVGISGRARTVVYNRDSLSEDELPASISDFTDPKWKGRIGWAPTNASFQTMVTAMRKIWGEERTREWLQGIQENDPAVYPKNTPIVAATAAGEIEVGFVNHYYLYRFIQENGESFAARNHYLAAGDPGSLVMVAGAGILETASNRENAEKFLRFMLSTVAQQYFAGQTYEYPLVEGVNTNRLLVPLSEINKPNIDMADLADIRGTQALLRSVGIIP